MANIDTTQEINKLLKEQNTLLAAQAKIMKSQASTMKAMVATMQNMPVGDVNKAFAEMNDAIKDADKALEDFGSGQQKAVQELTDSLVDAADQTETLAEKITKAGKGSAGVGALATAFTGLNAGLRAGVGAFGTVLSMAGDLTKSFFGLAGSIIALPFRVLGGLMGMAAQQGGSELRTKIEELREEMGDLSKNEGQAVMKSFRGMRKESVETGLGIHRVFGNMAQRLEFVTQMAKDLGRTFTQFSDEVAENGARLGSYQKGLGLSSEGMAALGKSASASGKSLIETSREITTMAYGMGEAFGINGKLISKDIMEMKGDFENFGTLGTKTMGSISAFTRKLGIEIKDLQGLVGKFDDFESAAQSAAQLSQAFGMQIDTLGMLKEEDPAARFETLRKAFLATGKSVESLSRLEKKLLASQTDISVAALDIGFAQGKQNMSYKDVQKQSEITEKKQLSQAEAMEKLSMSIKLMVKSGEQMKGGFFDIFLQGFSQGVKWSGPFQDMLRSLRKAMTATRQTGRALAGMFVESFPGVQQVFTNLATIFKGMGGLKQTDKGFKWFGFLGEIVGDFKQFSKMMTADPSVALKTLFKNLDDSFFRYFNKESPAGSQLIQGFQKFFVAIGKIFGMGMKIAMAGITEGLGVITQLVKNPTSLIKGAGSAGSAMSKLISDIFGPAVEAIKAQWPALKAAGVLLWETAWTKFGPAIKEFGGKALSLIKGMMWAAALSRLTISMTMLGLAKASEVLLMKGPNLLGSMMGKIFKKVPDSGPFKAGTDNFRKTIKGAADAGGAVSGGQGKLLSKINMAMVGKIALGLVAIAGVVAAIAYLAGPMVGLVKDVDPGEATKFGKIMGTMLLVYGGTALLMGVGGGIGALITLSGGAGVQAIAAGVAAIGVVAAAIAYLAPPMVGLVKDVAPEDATKFGKIMETMLFVYGGTALLMVTGAGIAALGAAGFGLGAVAIGLGLAAIAGVAKGMVKHTISLVKAIDKMKVSADLERKVSIFTSILDSMTGLGQVMSSMMSNSSSVFMSIRGMVTGKNPVVEGLKSMKGLMDGMFVHIKGIIELINKITANMTPAQITAGAALGELLGAVGALMKAITPPPELLKVGFFDEGTVIGNLQASADYMKKTVETMKTDVLPAVTDAMTTINGVPEIDPAKLQSFSTFMGSLGTMMTAFTPSPELIEALSKKTTSLWGAFDDTEPPDLTPVTTFMTTMINSMLGEGGVMSKISTFMGDFVKESKGMGTPEELTAASSLFAAVMQAISGFSGIFSGDMAKKFKAAGEPGTIAPLLGETFATYFAALSSDIASVKAMFVGDITVGIKDMITEINSVTNSLNGMNLVTIDTLLKQTADKLGLKGTEEFKIKINDINLTVEVNVIMSADGLEKALINRPGKKRFFWE